jgi:co-chaperonin GroES (HSP10)
MAIPKSAKLLEDEAAQAEASTPPLAGLPKEFSEDGPVTIKPVECLNDWVAVMQFRVHTTIEMPEGEGYKNEGIVIGVGKGLPDGSGGRLTPQLSLGDVVMFQDRAIAAKIQSDSAPYSGKIILMLSEKNVLCKLAPVPFEITEE